MEMDMDMDMGKETDVRTSRLRSMYILYCTVLTYTRCKIDFPRV